STAKRPEADMPPGEPDADNAAPGRHPPARPPADPPPAKPKQIGKYRIVRYLGGGGFGDVWLGWDDDLDRPVAIKVPRPGKLAVAAAAESFFSEAKKAAALVHPHLVPVFEVGRTDDATPFIVSRFIDGPTLRDRLRAGRVAAAEAARLVATVARALHHAHTQGAGLIHRDVKPANILIDEASATPFLADFGLAIAQTRSLAETDVAGTPAYMSPEQTAGEKVDGRSDLFSLGAVLYELLTGVQPFSGGSKLEILAAVSRARPVPPRDRDPTISAELERICLRALAKVKLQRYQTAAELADDLEAWLAERSRQTPEAADVTVVPKGLRSFDGDDAGFFLQLLPGPRGRDGLPESVRFWKTRFDESGPDKTFPIGLLYGPSGCGKSSLVKAGIVPRLGPGLRAIVLEASADDTESRLLKELRRAVPGVPVDSGLVGALAFARDSAAGKVVVVLDQFEQWLQAHPQPTDEDLVKALRQCDGGRLQALVLVRDDFGLAAFRFMQAVETLIVEGTNCVTIDIFPADHARDVLVRFGQGLGRLPRLATSFSEDEKAFVDQAIAGLAGDEKRVVPVQLALFADLVKSRPWTPATLDSLGETAGGSRRLLDRIGVAFLADAFDSRSANPAHRTHAAAAKRVLEALLPESGTQIKGHKRSAAELLKSSAPSAKRGDFDAVMRILDGELRLVTPTDPPGEESSKSSGGSPSDSYYQLTHDYLVPALRDWLMAGRRETAKGRAELVLAERTANWTERKEEAQQLPGLLEWLRIRWFTRSADWRPAARRMMASADRLHGTRGLSAVALAAMVLAGGIAVRSRVVERERRVAAEGAVNTLLNADMGTIYGAVAALAPHAGLALPDLRDILATGEDEGQKLKAALGVVSVAGGKEKATADGAADYLATRLLAAEPDEVQPIIRALEPRGGQLAERFAAAAADPSAGPQRLRAAAAMAAFDPDGQAWGAIAPAVAADLVNVPAVYLAAWLDSLRGARNALVPQLVPIFADPKRRETERALAADILADYCQDDPARLAELAMTAEPSQFAALAGKTEAIFGDIAPLLEAEIAKILPEGMPLVAPEREDLGIRQAKAAAVLIRFGRPERAWPIFIHSPDPRARSYLIHFVRPFAGENLGDVAEALEKRLGEETDLSARRGIVLALGELLQGETAAGAIAGAVRRRIVPVLQDTFERDPDPGLHAAAEWTLRQLGAGDWVVDRVAAWRKEAAAAIPLGDAKPALPKSLGGLADLLGPPRSPYPRGKKTPIVDPPQLAAIRKELSAEGPKPLRWFVNGQGQTMIVIPGPVEFQMGSTADSDGDRSVNEGQHMRRIGRTFAISAAHVTLGEYERIVPEEEIRKGLTGAVGPQWTRSDELPVTGMGWFEAARYCNALSKADGLAKSEWVYEEDGRGRVTGIASGWLSRSGYRLPTEAEWEYASRAGAGTSRFFGQSSVLLGDYAWYVVNSGLEGKSVPWPVGLKKPNDTGLFDGLGNAYDWCHVEYAAYPETSGDDDIEGNLAISREGRRVLRGASFVNNASTVRSAYRYFDVPTYRGSGYGLRVARTLQPGSLTPLPERGGKGETDSGGESESP
ncbi:MAG: hypothetical protein FJ309_15890, partial [Planctomycetes bacterium]|nr:hypothetical protein [Planctomycetota bacterium]